MAKVDNTINRSGGGDFIPLAGTEVGSPVTGDIEFGNGITFQNKLFSGDAEILFDNDSNLFILSKGTAYVRFDVGGINLFSNQGTYNSSLNLYETGLSISSDDPTSKGISGDIYYGANYDENTYVQKRYVDEVLPQVSNDFIDDAAAATGGIEVGGLYHTSGVVKIRLS